MQSNAHLFSQVPLADIPRSEFMRSHGLKTAFNADDLVPIFTDEVLPGDTYSLTANLFGRLSTPLKPILDNIFLETFFFFVPNRLLWNNWQKFNGEQENPNDSTDYMTPVIEAPVGGFAVGSLFDYMGMPVGVANIEMVAFYCRAYNLIYNEWFRDQNLIDSAVVDKGDSGGNPADYVLRKRRKRHDYFTSCLPWPQKGPSVTIPLGSTAPIFGNGGDTKVYNSVDSTKSNLATNVASDVIIGNVPSGSGTLRFSPVSSEIGLTVDLTNATAAAINQIRQAFQIQKIYERDARGGTRYIEIILSHFGVVSPDARLQRPEYLGGGSTRININTVAQTSASETNKPLGGLAAFGTVSASNHGFSKSFVEHGVIIGLANVRTEVTYQQGIDRHFSRRTRFDYFWPTLAHLGEQEVLNKEIYAQGTAEDEEVFGYQERYAEYRYKPSRITGKLRSNVSGTLDIWHLAQDFEDVPVLGQEFIEADSPMARILATPTEPHILLDAWFDLRTVRPMPVYSIPGYMDMF